MVLRVTKPVEVNENVQYDDIGDVVEQEHVATSQPAQMAQTYAPAPVAAGNTGMVPAGGSNVSILRQMKDVFERMGKTFNWNSYTALRATGGAIMTKANIQAGSWVKIRPLHWQLQYVSNCSAGDITDETKELMRISKDGKTFDDGSLCSDYVQELKEQGYPNARMEQRAVVVGLLVDSERKLTDLRYVLLSLSSSSLNNWNRFLDQRDMDVQFGFTEDAPNNQTVLAKTVSITNKQSKTYSAFDFEFVN